MSEPPSVRTIALDQPRGAALSIALEVSALRGGSHSARAFVDFALAALGAPEDVELRPWSVRRLRSGAPTGTSWRRPVRGRLGERAARLGVPVSTTWAAPQADVVFEASGPLALRTRAPGVLTVHGGDLPLDAPSRRRRRERLGRAASDGVVLHAMTSADADALADELDVPRASIAVAAPGVRVAVPPASKPAPPALQVLVLQGSNPTRDQVILDALRGAGATVELSGTPSSAPSTCCVLATPGDRFPLGAFESLMAGSAVVVARTPTTTELLEGAATLVDLGSTQDFVDATMELCTNEAARAIAVAAGRARADDFTWARRGPELVGVVRRSIAVR